VFYAVDRTLAARRQLLQRGAALGDFTPRYGHLSLHTAAAAQSGGQVIDTICLYVCLSIV